jgi:HD-GYP domain-containing protein (c-di-GMP phosphodiesterase class II)
VNPVNDQGLGIVRQFVALVRTGRAYDVRNRVFAAQLDTFRALLAPLLAERGEVVLVLLDQDLYLNGTRVPFQSSNFRLYQQAVQEFHKRDIAGLRLLGGNEEEMLRFFRIFLAADCPPGRGLLAACHAEGLHDVLPAIRASSEDATDAAADGAETRSSARAEVEEILADVAEGQDTGDAGPGGPGGTGSTDGGGDGTGSGAGSSGAAGADRRASPAGAAPKNYGFALTAARSLLTTTALQRGVEVRHAKRVVQPLVTDAQSREPIVLGLSALTHHDEYTYAHAANVCLLSVAIGYEFEMDRASLTDLGVAALLCDAGKVEVREPSDVPHHPVEGLKLIARHTGLNATTLRSMRVALEHHMGEDGAGYPTGNPGLAPSLFSRIVSAADCYVSLVGHRSAMGRNVTPHQALGMMLGRLRPRFDAGVLWALVNVLGFYPPGQQVLLDDGSVALVLAPDRDDLARPHVRLVRAPGASELPDPPPEYRPIPPERRVRRALRTEEFIELRPAA